MKETKFKKSLGFFEIITKCLKMKLLSINIKKIFLNYFHKQNLVLQKYLTLTLKQVKFLIFYYLYY